MGGKSSDNSEMISLQKQEAAEARAKEAARKERIAAGLDRIKGAFEGKQLTTTRAGPATRLAAGSLPSGYSLTTVGATPVTYRTEQSDTGHEGNTRTRRVAVPGSPGRQMVQGPNGQLYEVGATINPEETVVTGQEGGFDDSFFNKFRDSITGYYMPQVQQQYGDAQKELTYRLARAGSSQSSAGNEQYADLVKQNTLNEANVREKADKAVGDLKGTVANERASAESQLYATENPEVAANQALASVRNISATQPDLSPLASVFNLAAIGGAGALDRYNTERYKAQVPGYNPAGAQRIINA